MKIKAFENKVWLSSPTMHGEELEYMTLAYRTNWMSTLGENIDETEKIICEKIGRKHGVGLSCGTASLHMAVRLAGEKLFGTPEPGKGALSGKRVFCTDMTFDATVNPILYEGGIPVFIDTESDTWNMDPRALEKAFALYPDTKLVMLAHLYGVPAKLDEIKALVRQHGALLIEDAAESFGATYQGVQTGSFGDVSCISFNGNKIITGSSGGMLLTDDGADADKVRKWSTQSREKAPWYQHRELGYNYRMSNVIAGVVRGQLPHLEEHIAQKKKIYERYRDGLSDLPVKMNPFDERNSVPNYWLSCMIIDRDAMCPQERSDLCASFTPQKGKSCPTQILESLAVINAEGRPIWKPMHLQPIYAGFDFITADGLAEKGTMTDCGSDIFTRGLCLPSDNKMLPWQQDIIIEAILRCFA
ncbi:MAG: DegT/DnrJ/EryC1/StrS family aminotransferase [Acutalibacteraceae bacterium]